MKVTVESKIDFTPAMRKIESKTFWLYAAKEWQRVLYDYIPHDTNQLRQNVEYKPKEIHYRVPYAAYIYFGVKMVDPEYGVGGFTNDGGEVKVIPVNFTASSLPLAVQEYSSPSSDTITNLSSCISFSMS